MLSQSKCMAHNFKVRYDESFKIIDGCKTTTKPSTIMFYIFFVLMSKCHTKIIYVYNPHTTPIQQLRTKNGTKFHQFRLKRKKNRKNFCFQIFFLLKYRLT